MLPIVLGRTRGSASELDAEERERLERENISATVIPTPTFPSTKSTVNTPGSPVSTPPSSVGPAPSSSSPVLDVNNGTSDMAPPTPPYDSRPQSTAIPVSTLRGMSPVPVPASSSITLMTVTKTVAGPSSISPTLHPAYRPTYVFGWKE